MPVHAHLHVLDVLVVAVVHVGAGVGRVVVVREVAPGRHRDRHLRHAVEDAAARCGSRASGSCAGRSGPAAAARPRLLSVIWMASFSSKNRSGAECWTWPFWARIRGFGRRAGRGARGVERRSRRGSRTRRWSAPPGASGSGPSTAPWSFVTVPIGMEIQPSDPIRCLKMVGAGDVGPAACAAGTRGQDLARPARQQRRGGGRAAAVPPTLSSCRRETFLEKSRRAHGSSWRGRDTSARSYAGDACRAGCAAWARPGSGTPGLAQEPLVDRHACHGGRHGPPIAVGPDHGTVAPLKLSTRAPSAAACRSGRCRSRSRRRGSSRCRPTSSSPPVVL